MKVQTFIQDETKALIYDGEKLSEWQKQVDKLKLAGQQSLTQDNEKSPIPFQFLNTGEYNAINEVCQSSIEIEKYDKQAIPIEILSLVALAKQEGYFREIRVYYDDVEKDPFVIGLKEKTTYSDDYYVIACWGMEKKFSWTTLKALAKKKYVARRKLKMQKALQDLSSDIKNLNAIADSFLGGAYVSESYYG